MEPVGPRPGLCWRCGAILPELPADATGPVHFACTSCGLGVTAARAATSTSEPRSRRRRWRRPGPDADAQSLLARFALHREQLLRGRDFPVYGLDATWQGRRWVGGAGSSNGTVGRIELAHGDAGDEAAALLRVETRATRAVGDEHRIARDVARAIAQDMWRRGAEHSAVRAAFTDDDPTASWAQASVVVDGRLLPCRFVVGGDWWGGVVHVGGQPVKMVGRAFSFDDVRLVQIDDLEPYVADDGGPRP